MKKLVMIPLFILSTNLLASDYCNIVPKLHASESTEISVQAGQGVPGAARKVITMVEIGETLTKLCGEYELSSDIGGQYCEVVLELNAKELTETSLLAASGVTEAKEKAFDLAQIGKKLASVCAE